MFRRLSHTLPKDPEFPADLAGLGYYINENDQIRSIARPDQEFNYFISRNERVLEKQREAMNSGCSETPPPFQPNLIGSDTDTACIREKLRPRFQHLGLNTIALPSPAPTPNIPILVSSSFSTLPRIIIYFGESVQDLGIFAYRTIGQVSLAAGSCIDFVCSVQAHQWRSPQSPGFLIANCGQLIWWRRGARAVTQPTWNALPQKTGVAPVTRLDSEKNRVEGHRDVAEHIASVMAWVETHARKDAKIDVIGMGDASEEVVNWMNSNWSKWQKKLDAVAVGMAWMWGKEDLEAWGEGFRDFWGRRGRVYLLSDEPVDTPLMGRENFGCNCYSSGEPSYTECIMPKAYSSILAFFSLVATVPGYAEIEAPETLVDSGRDSRSRLNEILQDAQWRGARVEEV
ncbi:MAG: hypothetical protein Q9191_004292 [Dirinaria sp. TL-2023a]